MVVYHFGRFRESLARISQDFKLFSCLFQLAAVKSLSTPETVEPGKDNWVTWHFVHRLHGQNEKLCKIKKGDLKINGTTSQSCGLPHLIDSNLVLGLGPFSSQLT